MYTYTYIYIERETVESPKVYSWLAKFHRTFIDITITAIYPAAGLFLRDTRRRVRGFGGWKGRLYATGDEKTGVGRKGWLPVDDGATMAEYKSKSRAPSFLSRFSPTTPHPSIPRSLSIPSIYSPFPFFSYSSPLLSIFPISCVPLYYHHRNRPLFYFPLPSCLALLVYTSCVQRDSRNSIFLPTTPSYSYSIRVSRLVLFFSLNLLPPYPRLFALHLVQIGQEVSLLPCSVSHFIISSLASSLIVFPLLF